MRFFLFEYIVCSFVSQNTTIATGMTLDVWFCFLYFQSCIAYLSSTGESNLTTSHVAATTGIDNTAAGITITIVIIGDNSTLLTIGAIVLATDHTTPSAITIMERHSILWLHSLVITWLQNFFYTKLHFRWQFNIVIVETTMMAKMAIRMQSSPPCATEIIPSTVIITCTTAIDTDNLKAQ